MTSENPQAIIALWLSVATGAIAVGFFLVKTVLPWIRLRIRCMLGIEQISDALKARAEHADSWRNDLMAKVDRLSLNVVEMTEEFKPNSGETIRDALNRIETNVDLNGERFRARILDTDEMIFEADASGNVIWVNRTLCKKMRRLPGEILGNGWVNFLHPSDKEAVRKAWINAVSEEVELETGIRLVSTDGNIIPVRCKAYAMHDVNGIIIGWLTSFREIDEGEIAKKISDRTR